jgi:hypothetical protein
LKRLPSFLEALARCFTYNAENGMTLEIHGVIGEFEDDAAMYPLPI